MKSGKLHNLLLVTLLFAFASACSSFALPYQAGNYKVDVTVRNSAMNLIPGVKVSCWQYDAKNIVVEASSAGYKYAKKTISIRENQTYYRCDMVLNDLDRRIVVLDHNDRVISSAYIRRDQIGFPGDHYGITIYIPSVQWPVAEAGKMEVLDSFWGAPLKKSFALSQIEEFYCVKVSITRKSLKWSGSDLYVVFRTNQPVELAPLDKHLRNLHNLSNKETIPMGAEEALAEYISTNYSYDEIMSAHVKMPKSLKWLLISKRRFDELHRN